MLLHFRYKRAVKCDHGTSAEQICNQISVLKDNIHQIILETMMAVYKQDTPSYCDIKYWYWHFKCVWICGNSLYFILLILTSSSS